MIVNQLVIEKKDTIVMEITMDKITEIFCIIAQVQHRTAIPGTGVA